MTSIMDKVMLALGSVLASGHADEAYRFACVEGTVSLNANDRDTRCGRRESVLNCDTQWHS